MIVTLHWWIAPLALIAAGVFLGGRSSPSHGWWDFDIGPPLWFFGCLIAAAAVTVGHFL